MTVNTLPSSAEIISASQQNAEQKVDFASTWDFLIQKFGTKSGQGPETVASAASIDLDAVVETRDIVISGVVAITGFVVEAGKVFRCRASGAFTLTNNSGIVTNTGANIVAASGDSFLLRATATDTVEVLNFSGQARLTQAGLVELATDAEVRAGTDTARVPSAATMQANKMVLGTPLVTASPSSAASYDFTAIPSWVKRITVMFDNVSTNGSSVPIIQIGDAGGIETTGYAGAAFTLPGGGASTNVQNSNGFSILGSTGTTVFFHGMVVLSLMDAATNRWAFSASIGRSDANTVAGGGGMKALSATLDRIRLTTAAGTDVYDSGSVNISYE